MNRTYVTCFTYKYNAIASQHELTMRKGAIFSQKHVRHLHKISQPQAD